MPLNSAPHLYFRALPYGFKRGRESVLWLKSIQECSCHRGGSRLPKCRAGQFAEEIRTVAVDTSYDLVNHGKLIKLAAQIKPRNLTIIRS